MGSEEPTPETDPVTDEAISWIVLLRSGEATQADLDKLERWRSRSSRHESEFRKAAALWRTCREAVRELAADAVMAPLPSEAPVDPEHSIDSSASQDAR